MKIFSNFDTQLDEALFEKAKKQFWDDCVVFVRRDKIYMVFKVYLPFLFWFIAMCLVLLLLWWFMNWQGVLSVFLSRGVWISIIVSLFYLAKFCIVKMIDYYMDYAIITPDWVTQYDQTWVLDRSTRALDITKVKTVSVSKKWLLCSVFNFWSIVFFSEGDSDNWDIKLNYISDPIKLRDTIDKIVKKGVLMDKQEVVTSAMQAADEITDDI